MKSRGLFKFTPQAAKISILGQEVLLFLCFFRILNILSNFGKHENAVIFAAVFYYQSKISSDSSNSMAALSRALSFSSSLTHSNCPKLTARTGSTSFSSTLARVAGLNKYCRQNCARRRRFSKRSSEYFKIILNRITLIKVLLTYYNLRRNFITFIV